MASPTPVHCPGCGYENNPLYKFCGMCGTSLRRGTAPAPKTPSAAANISSGGYSILGLTQAADTQPSYADEPQPEVAETQASVSHRSDSRPDSGTQDSPPADAQQNDLLNRNLDYLFEEEKKSESHWRMYIALVLLVIAAATLVQQWHRYGYPWQNLIPPTPGSNSGTVPTASAGASATATPAAPSATQTNQAGFAPAATPTPAPETAKSEPAKSEAVNSDVSKVPSSEPPKPAPVRSDPSAAASSGTEQLETTAHDAKDSAFPAARVPGEASSPTEAARLWEEGTKYLLGNGVGQDCDRANKDLRAAARFSAEAQSTLGTMYASGHCVPRDLPTAYSWYARSLHTAPGNSQTQSDLTALWNEMSPAEKKAVSHTPR